MATTKKTASTTKKTTTRTAKPKLTVVKPEAEKIETVFEMVAKENAGKTTEVKLEDGTVISVRNRIGFQDMLGLVKSIVDTCTNDERGEVAWEALDYASRVLVCAAFCGAEVPADPEVGYLAVIGPDGLYEQIVGFIDGAQLGSIMASVRMKLQAKQEMYSSVAAERIKDMLNQVDDLMKLMQTAVDMVDSGEFKETVNDLQKTLLGELK